MGNLIWLLIFGALFFFMMRRGCGGSHGHGKRGHDHKSDSSGTHDQHKRKSGGCH